VRKCTSNPREMPRAIVTLSTWLRLGLQMPHGLQPLLEVLG